jgi:hypothetical protein
MIKDDAAIRSGQSHLIENNGRLRIVSAQRATPSSAKAAHSDSSMAGLKPRPFRELQLSLKGTDFSPSV